MTGGIGTGIAGNVAKLRGMILAFSVAPTETPDNTAAMSEAVSYTHLTLPTILLV